MHLDGIKHRTWLCRVDYTVYFVVHKFLNVMNQHSIRFYVNLALFRFTYSAFNFLNQLELIDAYSLAAQTHLQSVYLHQARYGPDHLLYKRWFLHNLCVFLTPSALLVWCKFIFVYLYIYVSPVCIILYIFFRNFYLCICVAYICNSCYCFLLVEYYSFLLSHIVLLLYFK